MAEGNTGSTETAELVAELDALLRLDRDAIRAYAVAGERLRNPAYRDAVERFCDDHERHVDELSRLRRGYGGRPGAPAPDEAAGAFEHAVRTASRLAGDRGVLLALKAHERRGRDRYRQASQRAYPPEVAAVLRRGTTDEGAHYAWVLETLDDLRLGGAVVAGRVERALEGANARMIVGLEGAERRAIAAAGGARRGVGGQIGAHPLRAAIVALAAGVVAAALTARRNGATENGATENCAIDDAADEDPDQGLASGAA
jgi:rubrerythrin